MIKKRFMALAALFMLFLVIAVPVTAAEKTFELNIPGCND